MMWWFTAAALLRDSLVFEGKSITKIRPRTWSGVGDELRLIRSWKPQKTTWRWWMIIQTYPIPVYDTRRLRMHSQNVRTRLVKVWLFVVLFARSRNLILVILSNRETILFPLLRVYHRYFEVLLFCNSLSQGFENILCVCSVFLPHITKSPSLAYVRGFFHGLRVRSVENLFQSVHINKVNH